MTSAFDLAVVGAGPGGIAAATVAAEAGLRVCLLDDNHSPGGQIWRGMSPSSSRKNRHSQEFEAWSDRLHRTNCEIWTGSQVIDHPAKNILRLERQGELCDLAFRQLILATGARERFLPFPGWTLPGVVGAGGLQALSKSGLEVHGKRVVIAGTGPLLLAIAAGLTDAGAEIVSIYEQAPLHTLIGFGLSLAKFPSKVLEGASYAKKLLGTPYRTGSWVKSASRTARFTQVTVTNGRKEWTHECDWLACGFHLVPNLELPLLFGCAVADGYVAVNDLQQSSVPNVACVGELTGIGGLDKAIVEGQIAGWFAAGKEDKARRLTSARRNHSAFADQLDLAFELRHELRNLCAPETIICRCEDVAYSTLRDCGSSREAKLHTRCGMGPCQGRICGPQTQFLFGWRDQNVRPPIFPAALSSIAALPATDAPEVDTLQHAG